MLRFRSPEEARTAMQQGFETMQLRNLAFKRGPGKVELDPVLNSIVRMVAMPEYGIVISSIRNGETPLQVYLFFKASQSVSVVFKDRFFHFTLFKEDQAMQRSLISWVGVSGQLSERANPVELQPFSTTDLLQKIWAQPERGPELFQDMGLSPEEAAKQSDFYNQVTLFTIMNRISIQDGRMVKQGQLTIMGASAVCWMNECGEVAPEPMVLQPVPASRASRKALSYLRSDFTLESQTEEVID
jgi:hypothetical protein